MKAHFYELSLLVGKAPDFKLWGGEQMGRNYELYLNKLVENSIETKGYMVDVLAGLKELSGKMDTLIALTQAGAQRPPQQQEPQQRR